MGSQPGALSVASIVAGVVGWDGNLLRVGGGSSAIAVGFVGVRQGHELSVQGDELAVLAGAGRRQRPRTHASRFHMTVMRWPLWGAQRRT
jgi:hypothetical protein